MTDTRRAGEGRPVWALSDARAGGVSGEIGRVEIKTRRTNDAATRWRYGVCLVLVACSLVLGCRPRQKPAPSPSPANAAAVAAPVDASAATAAAESEPAWSEPMVPLPSPAEAATNLPARLRLMMRDNARQISELTQRKAQLVGEARERDPELRQLYEAAVAARRRYDERLGQSQEIRQIDDEIEKMQRMQGQLLAQRQRFEKESGK